MKILQEMEKPVYDKRLDEVGLLIQNNVSTRKRRHVVIEYQSCIGTFTLSGDKKERAEAFSEMYEILSEKL